MTVCRRLRALRSNSLPAQIRAWLHRAASGSQLCVVPPPIPPRALERPWRAFRPWGRFTAFQRLHSSAAVAPNFTLSSPKLVAPAAAGKLLGSLREMNT